MPRHAATPICGFGRMDCVYKSEYGIKLDLIKSGKTCNCMPLCNDIDYEVTVYSSKDIFEREDEKLVWICCHTSFGHFTSVKLIF